MIFLKFIANSVVAFSIALLLGVVVMTLCNREIYAHMIMVYALVLGAGITIKNW